ENGQWKVQADGTMVTTWKIRGNALWHDGVPFTSDDLLFTAQVQRDKAIDTRPNAGYDAVDAIEAPDQRTVTVRWTHPYIYADALFNTAPIPKYLLESHYLQDKAAFSSLSYWTDDFVGTGPFKVRQFVGGSHVILQANDRFVLGRPKIDELEVRFIADSNTLAANLLAGDVEFTLGRNLSLDQAVQLRDQWRDGHVDVGLSGWIVVFPQFINSNPAIITDVRF